MVALPWTSRSPGPKRPRIFLTFVKSPESQKVRLLVGSDDALKIWVNGEQVLTSNTHA